MVSNEYSLQVPTGAVLGEKITTVFTRFESRRQTRSIVANRNIDLRSTQIGGLDSEYLGDLFVLRSVVSSHRNRGRHQLSGAIVVASSVGYKVLCGLIKS